MFVLKVGGSVLPHFENVVTDLNGKQFILVHGIGPQVDDATRNELGAEPRWYTSVSGIKCRYTDADTIRIFQRVAAETNQHVVDQLNAQNISAAPLNTAETAVLHAKRKERIKVMENGKKRFIEGDYTGKITEVNTEALQKILAENKIPVVPPFALGEQNEWLNVNGDRAAANIARALGIDTVINLSDVPGVLRDNEVIPQVLASELDALRQEVTGGMTIKLLGVREALDFGIQKIVIATANKENPVTSALNGEGTVFMNE